MKNKEASEREEDVLIMQIFSFRMVVEKILANGKKLYAAFMALEQAYDRADWLAL